MTLSRILSIALVTSLFACNRPAEVAMADKVAVPAGVERTEIDAEITSGTPVTFADLKIDGMTCAQMCGGSIKKALAALPGIASTEIKFGSPDGDHAVVTYDPAAVTDAQMIEAIQALHEGQYKVLAVSITKQVKVEGAAAEEENKGAAEVSTEVQAAAATAVAVMPSILELLSKIARF
ncbi:MAG: heavy-metal-associated domain-containing protein [Flavobacteriales bacterium]